MTPIDCDRHDTVRGMWRMWAWSVLLSVALYFLVRLLLSVGTQEPDLVDVLSLVFALVGILISLYQVRRSGDSESAKPWTRRKLIAVGVVIVLALAAVGLDWVIRENRDIDVTGEVRLSSNMPLGHNGLVTLTVPGNPPARANLALILKLSNVDRTGNCVEPARLLLQPLLDGEQKTLIRDIESGKEVTVPLSGTDHKAEIAVTVIQPSSERQTACQVRLAVSRAILQN